MDRNEYINLAQLAGAKFALYGLDWERAKWKESELVEYEGGLYIPRTYILDFLGRPIHGVRIYDIKANSCIETGLEKIKKVGIK
jgi:hypothetical protein